MTPERTGDTYYQQVIVVAGILAGMSFTALVLVLTQYAGYEATAGGGFYGEALFDFVITLIGLVCASFVFSALTALPIAGNSANLGGARQEWADRCMTWGILGFLAMLPATLLAYSKVGALLVGAFEVVVYLSIRSGYKRKG